LRPSEILARYDAEVRAAPPPEAGFEADEAETFLAFDLEGGGLESAPVPGVEIRSAGDEAGLRDFVTANGAAFGHSDHPFQKIDVLLPRLADGSLVIHVAYAEGQPISGGRLVLMPGSAFAGLYGGGTDPAWRGRGVYRALVATRAAEARARGVRYLTVDARETSWPILERLGFQALAQVTGWVLRAG
jgi:GNAT superfamily N-acetyltransferase